MKSRLNAAELRDAYQNIESLKKIVPQQGLMSSFQPGVMVGMTGPTPVTGIFAYATDRSMDAIKKHVEKLDAEMSDIRHRPDFVAVLGQGIIGPAQRLRNQTNTYLLSDHAIDVSHLSKTGRHILLRLYMRILDECNTVTLPPLDLKHYIEMPKLIGNYRVQRAEFVRTTGVPSREDLRVERLTVIAVEDILSRSAPVTRRQNYLNWVGSIPSGPAEMLKLDETIYQYNPRSLPAVDVSRFLLSTAYCSHVMAMRLCRSRLRLTVLFIQLILAHSRWQF